MQSVTSLIEESYTLERAGELAAALQRANQALHLARPAADAEAIAQALNCVAHLHFRQGHYQQGQTLAAEALAQAADDSPARVEGLLILGNCAAETDDPDSAETYYHQAIDLARQIGQRRTLRSALHNLSAMVYVLRGQFELALAADEESFRLALELDMPAAAWFPLATMGWVYWVTGQRRRAYAVLEQFRPFAPAGSLAEGFYSCLQADLAQDGEQPATALPLYAHARSIAEAIGDPGLNVLVRLGLSRYQRRHAGNPSAACHWANDALAIAGRVGYHHLQGMAYIDRGRANWATGQPGQAEADFRAAVELLTPLRASFDLARAHFLLAALLHSQARAGAEAAWLEATARMITGGYTFLLEQERTLAFPLLADQLNSNRPEVVAVSTSLLSHLAQVPPPPLRILALGRLEVYQRYRLIEEQAWRQRRAGELFRLLLVSPHRSLLREQAFEALWADKSGASAEALFHRATSSLRRVLEPDLPERFSSRYLSVDRGTVSLHLPPDSWLDFEAFEEAVKNQKWQVALDLYQGDLFPLDRYADWASGPRERLRHEAIRAGVEAARQHLHSGQPQAALKACYRTLALEPWQEEAVLLGMQACEQLNDRAQAIRLYQKLAHSLSQELGIKPQATVEAYYLALIE